MKKEERLALVHYRLEKAHEAFAEAKLLAENAFWSTVINRLYYSCFYAVSALLIAHEFSGHTHKGIKTQFNQQFIKSEKIEKKWAVLYAELFNMRQKGDYTDFITWEEQEVEPLLEETLAFLTLIEKEITSS